jgi:hypothetical protein
MPMPFYFTVAGGKNSRIDNSIETAERKSYPRLVQLDLAGAMGVLTKQKRKASMDHYSAFLRSSRLEVFQLPWSSSQF